MMGIYTVCHKPLTVPLHSPNGRQIAVQGDCETVVVGHGLCPGRGDGNMPE